MATVKIKYRKSIKSLWNYVMNERSPDDPIDFVDCNPLILDDNFLISQGKSKSSSKNEAIHIIQSWGPEESKQYDPWIMNEIGKKLCEEYFPGHAFAVVTHTDTGKTHNHIVLNPVNIDGKDRIENQKRHLYRLREINDRLAKEKGLSIIRPMSREGWDAMTDEVRAIHKNKGYSKTADLYEKVKFAKSVATSFDEFSGYLNYAFDIKVKIRGKSVTYIYPGMSRGKRADKMGKQYMFAGLEKRFRANDQRLVDIGFKTKEELVGKDYSKYHKFRREETEYRIPESKLKDSLIPIKDIKELRRKNIEEYCKENDIELYPDGKGGAKLSGREYIKINGTSWENEKTRIKGNLIEFISNYEKANYLTAIRVGSRNSDLKVFEEGLELDKRSFQAFYVPSKDKVMAQKRKVYEFASANRFNRNILFELSKAGKFRVIENGRFKIYPHHTMNQSLSFYSEPKTGWQSSKIQGLKLNFFEKRGKSNDLIIFDSPITFFKSERGEKLLGSKDNLLNVMIPMKPFRDWVYERKELIDSFDNIYLVQDKKSIFDEILSFKESSSIKSLSVEELDRFIQSKLRGKEV